MEATATSQLTEAELRSHIGDTVIIDIIDLKAEILNPVLKILKD